MGSSSPARICPWAARGRAGNWTGRPPPRDEHPGRVRGRGRPRRVRQAGRLSRRRRSHGRHARAPLPGETLTSSSRLNCEDSGAATLSPRGTRPRFTVHRPGYFPASRRSHDLPGRDVPGRVHVSIGNISAQPLRGLRSDRQPREFGTRFRELTTLGNVPGRSGAAWPPVRVLLQGQVPHKPGVAARLTHDQRLLRSRYEPVSGHKSNLLAIADTSEEVMRRPDPPPGGYLHAAIS